MLRAKRLARVLEILRAEGFVSLGDIAEKLDTSVSTVRGVNCATSETKYTSAGTRQCSSRCALTVLSLRDPSVRISGCL